MLCETPSLSRRALLGSAGALFAWAYMPKFVFAAGNRDARFIVIVLRGALDGLSAVAPFGDPDYESLHGSPWMGRHLACRSTAFFCSIPRCRISPAFTRTVRRS